MQDIKYTINVIETPATGADHGSPEAIDAGRRVAYPAPRRISLEAALELLDAFLSERSGGERYEVLTAAMFRALGSRFGLFERVQRTGVTAADVPSGTVADIECVNAKGEIVLAVEAKDRHLTITQVQDKIPGFREHQVAEAFFVAERGMAPSDEEAIRELVRKEFVSGQNLYVTDLRSFARVVLAILNSRPAHSKRSVARPLAWTALPRSGAGNQAKLRSCTAIPACGQHRS